MVVSPVGRYFVVRLYLLHYLRLPNHLTRRRAELNAVARADGVRSLSQNPDNTLLLSVSLLGYS